MYTLPECKGFNCEYRGTIAVKREGNDILYGVSICGLQDNFNKKLGRELAERRMNTRFGLVPINKLGVLWAKCEGDEERFLLGFASALGSSLKGNWEKYKNRIAHYKAERLALDAE
jgi:hypothetical protein